MTGVGETPATASHVCLLCGRPVQARGVEPLSAVLSVAAHEASAPDPTPGRPRRRRPGLRWWERPPGQYWLHVACLREHAHPSVPLQFLDIVEPPPRER